jgi:hypothetical protein
MAVRKISRIRRVPFSADDIRAGGGYGADEGLAHLQTMKKYGVKMREIAPRHRLLLRDAFVPRHAGRVIAVCVDAREPVSLYYWLRRLFKTDSAKV